MNAMPFHPPTDYYCKELAPLDEEICSLLAKRKELSNQNPGFPDPDLIAQWSQAFGLKEYWLCLVFAHLLSEEQIHIPVEPVEFLRFIPVLRSVTVDKLSHTVTYLKQYSNASIVYIETEVITPEPFGHLGHAMFELSIAPEYLCTLNGGGGSGKTMQHSFVVTPPLPDDVSEVEFHFKVKPLPEPEFQRVLLKEITVTI
ncbi:hypothetical protein [Desulfitobacterium chlororespirans]|uniref:Uncharacterized protein n=1 Tax=Desulfitobacterium chlororespirans DSM 11544 TaxID=1121395 RepID=A0A1M7RWI2_9FIRM|nr:hypothetical protein [Desulfitobacterium chlororespirans]SHN50536.1 hypothetical protein SAMN02745215_00195 [Desulfitobacterium chlororespirans DSM 11544]